MPDREYWEDLVRAIIKLVITVIIAFVIAYLFDGITAGLAETNKVYVVVSEGDVLRGREKPSTSSDVLMRFTNGDELTPISTDGDWLSVEEGGEAGQSWVHLDYICQWEDGPKTMVVTSNGRVNVRKSTSTKSKVVGYVRDSDTVLVYGIFDGWLRTDKGWIKDSTDGSYSISEE